MQWIQLGLLLHRDGHVVLWPELRCPIALPAQTQLEQVAKGFIFSLPLSPEDIMAC
jgi:hypothetical protein